MNNEDVELLFFDTFAHETSEELNLDLVQFPKPVYITQIRIIPLGARVQADFPGGVRLGATNPSQFTIELFVNDLSRPGASTFESLGGLEYNQNGCIHTECARRIPTDGLVLRGWYTTITLAVYGLLTVNLGTGDPQIRGPQDILPVAPQSTVPATQQAPIIVPVVPVQTGNNVPIIPEVHATVKSDWKQDNIVPETYPQNSNPIPTNSNNSNTVIIDPSKYNQTYSNNIDPQQQSTTNQSVNAVIVQDPDYNYYPTNEPPPKDPRSYHTPDSSDWDSRDKSRTRSSLDIDRDRLRDDRDGGRRDDRDRDRGGRDENRERDRIRDDRDNRDRGRDYQKIDYESHIDRNRETDRDRRERRYSRSHSRDRDRDRDRLPRDRDHERHEQFRDNRDARERDRDRDVRERDRDRDRYPTKSRSYRDGRDDREDRSKRPRTPPPVVVGVTTTNNSPKRPHTPHLVEPAKAIPLVDNICNTSDVIDSSNITDKPKSPVEAVTPNIVKNEELDEDTQQSIPPIDIEEFEPILSDEDIVDDSEQYPEVDYDFSSYTNNDDLIKLFTPGVTPISMHETVKPFGIANGIIEVNNTLKGIISFADDFFKETITKYSLADFTKCNTELKEEFVHLNEKVMHVLENIENFHHIVDILMLTKANTDEINQDYKASNDGIVAQVTNITSTLIEWLKIALDYEMANAQTQPGYKIRHIKCGVRLAEICASDTNFIELMWQNSCFLDKLLMKLYNEDYMALSIKLLILKTLDTYLLNENAIKAFMMDNYRTLIDLVLCNPSVRIKFALNSILKKLNLFEVLCKMQNIILKCNSEADFTAEEMTYIIKSLIEILNICQSDMFIFSQPKRFLPVASQFEINRSETKPIIITFFKMHNFLQCIMVLLMHPNTMNISTIKSSIFEIISDLIETKEGLQYLSENMPISNVLVKYLMQVYEEIPFNLLDSDNKSLNLGLKLAYTLQTYYHFESFKNLVRTSYDYDNLLINEHLHGLFCLTFTFPGKFAGAKLMGLPGNMTIFLNLLNDNPTRHRKAPEIGYMVDLIINNVIFSPNVRLLETCSKQLLLMLNNKDLFEASVSMKLADVADFFKPLEIPSLFNYEKIDNLVEIINKNLDNIINLPGQIITALRILELLGIPQNKIAISNENNMNTYSELKHKHVILQLFSLEGVQLISNLLRKITSYFEQPALHTSTYVSSQGILIVNTVRPAIKLLKQMLTYVIECRNTNYKDLTTIPVVLQTYSLLNAFPPTSVGYSLAQSTCQEIIDTLLVFTQPINTEMHEKDSLNKTLWSLMCGEVIKYITTAPYTFMSGLLIFSELLPLPLPIQTQEDLNEEEIIWAINLRKLWSAHLHPNSTAIQELISKLCTTTNQAILNLLRRVSVQLSDLAANSAITIARGVLDIVHEAIVKVKDDQVIVPQCNNNSVRVLNFLACLVTHSTIKCAVLNLISTSGSFVKSDDKYPQLVTTFAQVLKMNSPQPANTQQQLLAQECICSIIQTLCDAEITLLQSTPSSEKYLSNALPDKEHIALFISSLVDHLSSEQYSVTYIPILRTLLLLTEHDYGFYYLREYLLKHPKSLYKSLLSISNAFLKTNPETVNAATTMIDFLRVCCMIEDIIEPALLFQPRSVKLCPSELAGITGWDHSEDKSSDENKAVEHPLIIMKEHFKALTVDDPNFENIVESAESLLKYISLKKSEEEKEKDLIITETILPQPESLLNQFSSRIIYTTSDSVDDRLTAAYWLALPTDEGDVVIENATVDLIDIYRQHFPQGLNLVKVVENMCRISPTDGNENIEKEKLNAQKDRPRRPFVTSGRGGGSGSPSSLLFHSILSNHQHAQQNYQHSTRHNPSLLSNTSVLLHHHPHPSLTIPGSRPDPFRSRPPNTSRPPSLHVDDFVALETRGAQPTGPTGYNALSREQVMLMQQQQQRQGAGGMRGAVGHHSGSRLQLQSGSGQHGGGGSRGNYRQMSWWGSNTGRGMYH